MIERLVIHRFRGIREGVLDDLGKINLLIGPNNSGKTAVLEMLYLGGTSGRLASLILDDIPLEEGEAIAFRALTSTRWDFSGLEPLPRLRVRHGHTGERLSNLASLTAEGGLEVNLDALTDYRGPLTVFRLGSPLPEWGTEDKLRFFKKDAGRIALFSIELEQEGLPKALTPKLFSAKGVNDTAYRRHYLWDPSWVYRWDRAEPIDHLAAWAEKGRPPDAQRVLFFDFHGANDHFSRRFAQWAKNQKWDWLDKIREHLTRVFPTLDVARVEVDDAPDGQKGEAGYIRTREGRLIVDQFGDGARHAFKMLAGLVALCESVDEEHSGLFLWEDPELFMHPAALNRLLREVLRLTKDKPIQVFLSSQSIETTALLTAHIEEMELQSGYRVLRLDLQEGKLYAAKYHYENVMAWLEAGMDLRFWGAVDLPIAYRYRGSEEEQ